MNRSSSWALQQALKKKSKELGKILQKTDFEISKLNSIEFDIDI